MQNTVLEAEIREGSSSRGSLRGLREGQKIPGVIYGGRKPPLPIVVSEKALKKATEAAGANTVLTLKHPKGEDTVLLKEISHDVVTHRPLHVDFQRITLTQKLTVKVHLKLVGEAPGVKLQGGILEHLMREIEVKCLPTAIPHELTVDISTLEINHSIRVKDLVAPADVEIHQDPEQILVNIVAPREEEVAAPAAAEGVTAEPEVIAKGKKEEEGEGAAAEKGEKGKETPKKEGGEKGGEKKEGADKK